MGDGGNRVTMESADDGHVAILTRLDFFLFAGLAAARGGLLFSHRFPQIKHGFKVVRIRENP